MKDRKPITSSSLTGNQMLRMLLALANPHRLRIVAALRSRGRNYISQLARDVGISRPLLHLHLNKLEEAGLVTSQLELSDDGKALNFFEVTDFSFDLSPATIAAAIKSLTLPSTRLD
ncbi:ArsR/SmtB family transcription factor [Bradyrhizobium sp.]|uniref:ArsR/SmtB family transcription factor n=1 Tax=Bradyrhizobium sp. TaxID=376 RepID=UPI003D1142BB